MIIDFKHVASLVKFDRHFHQLQEHPLNGEFTNDSIGIEKILKTNNASQYQAGFKNTHITFFEKIVIGIIYCNKGEAGLFNKLLRYEIIQCRY